MAVKIRLARFGRKKVPTYRVVVADSRRQRDGRIVETLGTYDPRAPKAQDRYNVKVDRLEYWLQTGAQPTPTVDRMAKRLRRNATAPSASASTGQEAPAAADTPPSA